MQPLLSIVIANYNYGRFLEETIQSVLCQVDETMCLPSGERIELIIVDGGSNDNSVEIINKYADRLAWWCSEKDRGQSHAFNKGFSKASGKLLTWVNADDLLCPGTLEELARRHKRFPDCEWFTGNFFRFIDKTGRVSEIGWGPHIYPYFLQRFYSPLVVFGPSTIFAKALYDRIGGINETLHFCMDTELWLRFMKHGVRQRRLNCFIYAFRMQEQSKTAEFGDHKLSVERRMKFENEKKRMYAETNYKPSRLLRFALLGLRCLDGSILNLLILRHKFLQKNYLSVITQYAGLTLVDERNH